MGRGLLACGGSNRPREHPQQARRGPAPNGGLVLRTGGAASS